MTLEVEVNKPNVTLKWFKDGHDVSPDDRIDVLIEGCVHKVHIKSAVLTDEGLYKVTVGLLMSEAPLTVEGTRRPILFLLLLVLLLDFVCFCSCSPPTQNCLPLSNYASFLQNCPQSSQSRLPTSSARRQRPSPLNVRCPSPTRWSPSTELARRSSQATSIR